MIDPMTAFIIIAVVGFVMMALMLVIGDVFDFDMDVEVDGDISDNAFSPISPLFLSVFASFYGMWGIVLLSTTSMGIVAIAVLSVLLTLPVHLGAWWGLNKVLGKTTGVQNTVSIVGQTANTTLPIESGAVGQVCLNEGLTQRFYPAVASQDLPANVAVRITGFDGQTVTVTKLGEN